MASSNHPKPIDWGKCCLCQTKIPANNDIRHPYINERYYPSYTSLQEDILQFKSNGFRLPLDLDARSLDDGSGIKSTLLKNRASFHHSCR